MTSPSLLKPGENCWRIEHAERLAFLIDGEDYFSAFYQAAQRAEHSIFILSWDIDTRVKLIRDEENTGGLPTQLGDFLNALASRRTRLQIHVLNWDWAMLFALEREWLPQLEWETHKRVHFHLDDAYPTGASQHQKIVVIDDTIAFVGGFDLTKQRWDSSSHRPLEPWRTSPAGKHYPPFHDVQLMVEGDCAAALGELARQRWYRATGQKLSPEGKKQTSTWPPSVKADMQSIPIAIARTVAEYKWQHEVREVEQLYLDTIAAAKKYIYIENQYFTSWRIGEALASRLREPSGPEVVLVLPKMSSGWLEQYTMDVLRSRLLQVLQKSAPAGRLRVYYPFKEDLGEDHIVLHSKVMVVDELLLRVGSSNLSNRSMGLDSECDLVIEANTAQQSALVASFRNRLLSEHLGVSQVTVAEQVEKNNSLIGAIKQLNGNEHGLCPLDANISDVTNQVIPEATIIDPERPLEAERLAEYLLPAEERKPTGQRLLVIAIVLGAILAMTAAWRWSPLSNWLDQEALMFAATWVKESPFSPFILLAVYLLGGLIAFPVTVLIVITIITFGPWTGSLYALAGAELSALLGYAIGDLLGRDVVRHLTGSNINRISQRLAKHGMLSVITVRIIPIAPFTVTNLVAGASHISLRDFALGNLLGLFPGTVAIALFTGQLMDAVREPNLIGFILLVLVVASIAIAAITLKGWLSKKKKLAH